MYQPGPLANCVIHLQTYVYHEYIRLSRDNVMISRILTIQKIQRRIMSKYVFNFARKSTVSYSGFVLRL